MSSKSRKFRASPLRFQTMGGRRSPWTAQVSTVLRPTVTVATLTLSSGARLSCTTSAGKGEAVSWRPRGWSLYLKGYSHRDLLQVRGLGQIPGAGTLSTMC